MQYRVAFDTTSNRFMAIDAQNENNVAFGITIEQAVRALNESRYGVNHSKWRLMRSRKINKDVCNGNPRQTSFVFIHIFGLSLYL